MQYFKFGFGIFLALILLGAGCSFQLGGDRKAISEGEALPFSERFDGRFEFPKKTYSVGETVTGKFIVEAKDGRSAQNFRLKTSHGNYMGGGDHPFNMLGNRPYEKTVRFMADKPGTAKLTYTIISEDGSETKIFTDSLSIVGQVKDTTSEPAETEKEVSGPKNCSSSLNCLAEAAATCQLAKATVAYSLDLLGANHNFTDYYEIKGSQNDGCILYTKTTAVTVSYSESAKQGLLDQGMTEAQIAEYEKNGTTDAQKNYVGKYASCVFATNNALVDLLNKWKAGDRVSTTLSKAAQCSGTAVQ